MGDPSSLSKACGVRRAGHVRGRGAEGMGTQRAGVQGYVRVVAGGGRGEGLVEEAVDERHSYVQGNVDEDTLRRVS